MTQSSNKHEFVCQLVHHIRHQIVIEHLAGPHLSKVEQAHTCVQTLQGPNSSDGGVGILNPNECCLILNQMVVVASAYYLQSCVIVK